MYSTMVKKGLSACSVLPIYCVFVIDYQVHVYIMLHPITVLYIVE